MGTKSVFRRHASIDGAYKRMCVSSAYVKWKMRDRSFIIVFTLARIFFIVCA